MTIRNPAQIRVSVVICNYNYKHFIRDAISSALLQSHPPHEVIVVDDGSTDGSAAFVSEEFGDEVRLFEGPNRGQLAAFTTGVAAAGGDFIALLDSDDTWRPDHLESIVDAVRRHPYADFFMGMAEMFGTQTGKMDLGDGRSYLGLTATSLFEKSWIGSTTSCLVIRAGLLKHLLALVPEELLGDWKVRADDVIVYGGSILGGRKLRLQDVTVNYRVHGNNSFHGKDNSKDYNSNHALKVDRLFAEIVPHSPLPRDFLYRAIEMEVRSGAQTNLGWRWRSAKKALKSRGPLAGRVRVFFLCLFRSFDPMRRWRRDHADGRNC